MPGGLMNDYTSERLTHVAATLRLEAINPMKVFMISVMMMVLRLTRQYPLFLCA